MSRSSPSQRWDSPRQPSLPRRRRMPVTPRLGCTRVPNVIGSHCVRSDATTLEPGAPKATHTIMCLPLQLQIAAQSSPHTLAKAVAAHR